MITGRQLINSYYEEEKLYSTGDDYLDELLERAFCEGYEYAQKEFAFTGGLQPSNVKPNISTVKPGSLQSFSSRNNRPKGPIANDPSNKMVGLGKSTAGATTTTLPGVTGVNYISTNK